MFTLDVEFNNNDNCRGSYISCLYSLFHIKLYSVVENTDASNERYKAAIIGTRTPTVASICDRTTYDAGTEHILLKNDGE